MARTTLTITLDEAWDKARAWDPCGHKDRTVFWSNNGEDFKCDLEYLADDWDDDDCEPRIVEMILCVHRGMDVYDLLERYYDEDHEFGRFDDALKTEEAKRLQVALDDMVAAVPMWDEIEVYDVALTSDEVKMLVGYE